MNAHARPIPPARAAGRAEHVAIEATQDYLETMSVRQPHRPTVATYTLRSALRGCSTELRILQDHFLAVQYERPRQPPKKFTFDLRFANPRPMRVRKVAWICLGLAIACCLATAAAFAWAGLTAATLWTHPGFIGGIAGTLAALTLLYLFLRRTTESLRFTSVHGNAVLIDLVGGIGAAKSGKSFVVDLIKNITAAKLARPQPPAQFLRDEMREHHRLRELNVLSQEEYETSKARILASYS
ncbi:MAG TPA: hypothetical protein PKE27_09860 [Povalibacter sp.]|uniref:hypothetical protein n=1 Tax=Povalibacter sp. TaxID=1962978 RepID=UPI002CADAC71|nr:hypothetical protein [Povalibacter sp.]HMN44868.1 hypothetical protein [Povalibacter sp.]